ncbi:hypothetical protein Tco_0939849 [Tanacetum coccineum]|uniref:Uncharacterized protein n=1 Tax=Tanacetum coccineum TaxID=301880 RepID=A0ABQ5DT32_9ASTR
MSMTIQSSVKDKILATQSETSKVRQNVVIDALRRKEEVKPRRVRAMAMTIQYGVRGMILAAQSEAFKRENVDDAKSVSDAIGFEYCLASSSGWTKSPVIWAEIEGSSLIGPELVQETTDKVVLIKEKLKAARDRQKSLVIIDANRWSLRLEMGVLGLVLHQMTSDHNRSELGILRPSSMNVKFPKLCFKVVPHAVKTAHHDKRVVNYIPTIIYSNDGDNRLGINPMIQPEPEDLPKDNPKLEIAVLRWQSAQASEY